MSSQVLKTALAAAAALALLASCASKPTSYTPLSATADPSAEISKTDDMIRAARDRQVDILSPKNFAKAEDTLSDAKEARAKDKSNEKVLEKVAYSRGWLTQAEQSAEVARASTRELTDARANAWRAGADKAFPKDWKKVEGDARDITRSIEKGNLKPADRNTAKVVEKYRDLEVRSVTANTLGKADANLKAAMKNGARQNAPKTFALAENRYNAAEAMIKQNPRNSVAINRAAEEATRESARLIAVNDRVRFAEKAGTTEDFVLRDDRQRRMISGLREEAMDSSAEAQRLARSKAELQQKQELIDKANRVRSQFSPNEAEVYTQGDKVMIRLKGMQFATNKANITPHGARLLDKVDTALNEFEDSKVVIEGHTDSVGSRQANKVVSQRRAQAVENYLVKKGGVEASRIETVGMGYASPVSDNKTAKGRAENRRIDVIIEAK